MFIVLFSSIFFQQMMIDETCSFVGVHNFSRLHALYGFSLRQGKEGICIIAWVHRVAFVAI